jgi:hypothetical protein
MRNQFFYTRTVTQQAEGTEGVENTVTSTFRDSLNLEMVIRSVTLPTGEVVVLLNDIHEQLQQIPVINHETNEVENYREVRTNVQSEINLSPEDGRRFFEITNIEFSNNNTIFSNCNDAGNTTNSINNTRTERKPELVSENNNAE